MLGQQGARIHLKPGKAKVLVSFLRKSDCPEAALVSASDKNCVLRSQAGLNSPFLPEIRHYLRMAQLRRVNLSDAFFPGSLILKRVLPMGPT